MPNKHRARARYYVRRNPKPLCSADQRRVMPREWPLRRRGARCTGQKREGGDEDLDKKPRSTATALAPFQSPIGGCRRGLIAWGITGMVSLSAVFPTFKGFGEVRESGILEDRVD